MSTEVRDVMTSPAIVISPRATFKQAAARLREHRIAALPVVDVEGCVIGVVSEADLVLREADPTAGGRHGGRTVGEVMTAPALTVRESATVRSAARIMVKHRVRRLPVVDARGHPVGVVSRADVLKVFLRGDDELPEHVVAFLAGDLRLDVSRLEITVDSGVVRVAGDVAHRGQALALVRLLPYLEGVVDVNVHVSWRDDDSPAAPVGDAWPHVR